MSRIQSRFPEVTLNEDHQTIKGVVDGRFCSIKINRRFINQANDLIQVYKKYYYMLKVKEKGKDGIMNLSIGEFLDQTTKLSAKILTRFKGLGELNAEDMFSTALDINNRVSIQFTVEDAERETEIFKKLHSDKPKYVNERKDMMSQYKIARDDLDN